MKPWLSARATGSYPLPVSGCFIQQETRHKGLRQLSCGRYGTNFRGNVKFSGKTHSSVRDINRQLQRTAAAVDISEK